MHLWREPVAIQGMLDEAADDARRVVGEAHYTGCRLRQESRSSSCGCSTIEANVVGPSEDGYLRVGVPEDAEAAQKKLDAIYGSGVAQAYESGPIRALPLRAVAEAQARR